MSGFGNQPFGSTPYSLGAPVVTDGSPGKILQAPETQQTEGSRYINPVTRDFELDENGRFRGQPNVRHLVQHAVQTLKSSSAMREFGLDIEDIEVITADTERRLARALDEAVAHLVAANLIVALGVTRFVAGPSEGLTPGRTYTRFAWRDVSTGEQFGETF